MQSNRWRHLEGLARSVEGLVEAQLTLDRVQRIGIVNEAAEARVRKRLSDASQRITAEIERANREHIYTALAQSQEKSHAA
jgi:uncharacterized protein YdbL (DUF1318 family)